MTECLVSTICVWTLSGSTTSLMVLTGPATGPNPLSCCPFTGLSTVCHIRAVPCYRARWLREIGFVGREYKRWYHQKPKCADNSQGFVSVRIQDFYPALVVFAYGVALSLVILILEIAYSKLQRRCREWRPAVRHSARSHQNTRTLLQNKTATKTAELRQSCDSGLADITENAPPDSSALTGGCRKALPKSTTLAKWVAGLRVGSTTSMCIVVVILERQTATVGMPLLSGLRTSLLHSPCLLATRYARYATALVATARSPKRLLKADHTVRYMFRHIMVISRCKYTNGRCNTEQCSSLATDFFLSISFITLPIANINISTYTAYIKI